MNWGRMNRICEFFAGIGLMRLGLERAGFSCVFANDIDPDKAEQYRTNFGDDEFLLGDIHALEPADLPDCELFTASFPCNDLSVAGARAGLAGAQSGAYWGLIRILEALGDRRPESVLLENVPGFLTSHGGRDFAAALAALSELGYGCDAFLLDARHFTPQSRLRLFVVARLGAEEATFTLDDSILRPAPLRRFIHEHPEIRWSIEALPDPPERTSTLVDILEDLPDDDPAWWNAERTEYFMNQLSERHLGVAQSMIAAPTVSFGTAFRRVRKGRSMAELRTDGLAGCLRTPRGGSGRQILFKAGGGRFQVRLLTARECARLQGVPDDYKIDVPLNKALFGFGDAVCVPAITWIASNYLARSFERDYVGAANPPQRLAGG